VSELRLASLDDAVAIASIYAPWVEQPGISFELEAPTPGTMATRVVQVIEAGYPWLVAQVDGRVRAYAYANRFRERPAYDWVAETSIYVDREWQGQGLGERLYGALLDVLAIQGLRWAYGAVVVDPEAVGPSPSQRFHARMGFEAFARFAGVGYKRERWWDIEWWRFELDTGEQVEAIRSISDPAVREAVAERLSWTR
jgi:L-amino acid N-acyltransferase YncA